MTPIGGYYSITRARALPRHPDPAIPLKIRVAAINCRIFPVLFMAILDVYDSMAHDA